MPHLHLLFNVTILFAMLSLLPFTYVFLCLILQACNAHGIYCVPLYDTLGKLLVSLRTRNTWNCIWNFFFGKQLSVSQHINVHLNGRCLFNDAPWHLASFSVVVGAGAVEFILCHAEVEIAFIEEKKIGEVNSFTGTLNGLTAKLPILMF